MSYLDDWQSVSARIRNLISSAELYTRFRNGNSEPHGAIKDLNRQCDDILNNIECFNTTNKNSLPPNVENKISKFLKDSCKGIAIKNNACASDMKSFFAHVIFMSALESEVTFLLTDRQQSIFLRSERAFLHLNRILAVDEDARKKWLTALNVGETKCERLGAVHLLWHGIYAFKVNGEGARTDLVFNNVVGDDVSAKGIEGLVLTEWKVATQKNAAAKFNEARNQAKIYGAGLLAGIELSAYRYAVVVTEKSLPGNVVPDDLHVNGVIWRHINIPVNPDTPSIEAKKSQ